VSTDQLDQSVFRIYRELFKHKVIDRERHDNVAANVTSEAHIALATKLAEESMVLLKNENDVLPLSKELNILVLGDKADEPHNHGDGSGAVDQQFSFTPIEAICNEMGVPRYARGTNFFSNGKLTFIKSKNLTKEDLETLKDKKFDVAILFLGTTSGEGSDRQNLDFDSSQTDLMNYFN
jgi:beta-glucosidase